MARKDVKRCKYCGAFISWLRTNDGHNVPVDPRTINDTHTVFDDKTMTDHRKVCTVNTIDKPARDYEIECVEQLCDENRLPFLKREEFKAWLNRKRLILESIKTRAGVNLFIERAFDELYTRMNKTSFEFYKLFWQMQWRLNERETGKEAEETCKKRMTGVLLRNCTNF